MYNIIIVSDIKDITLIFFNFKIKAPDKKNTASGNHHETLAVSSAGGSIFKLFSNPFFICGDFYNANLKLFLKTKNILTKNFFSCEFIS